MTITSVVNQLTERITRGSGVSDTLLYTPISVIRVGLQADTDDLSLYTVSGNTITWSGTPPNTGQAYYVTYQYNPTQFLKDFNTIAGELVTDFNTLLPNLDITKSAARDLFVNVLTRQFTDLYNGISHVSDIQSLQNPNNLTSAELDALGVNYSISRIAAIKASGFANFTTQTPRAYTITIPNGTRLGTLPSLTNNQQVTFVTVGTVTISTGFTGNTTVPIEADIAGIAGNVSAGAVSILIDSVDVDLVSNPSATTGGQEQESNTSYAARLISAWKARNIGTVNGIAGLVLAQPNVQNVYIADVGDPVMVRDNNLGGKVDVYVQSESGYEGHVAGEVEIFVASNHYVFLNQPVISIDQVEVDQGSGYFVIDSTWYSLEYDTGLLAGSTRAVDSICIVLGPTLNIAPGNYVRISYTYNKLFKDIQTLLDNDQTHIAGIDVLVRGATETFIDVTGSIQIGTGFVFADVQTSIVNQITNYIEAKSIGSRIVYGDIINIIHDTPGVIDLLPLSLLTKRGQGTAATIQMLGNEYPRAGNILITPF